MSTGPIYRASPDARAAQASWLWSRPERVTPWAFVVGFAGGAASLGALAIITEEWAFTPRTQLQALQFAGALLGSVVVNALVWGLVVRAVLSLGYVLANLLLVLACGAASLLVLAAIVFDGADHPPFAPSVGIVAAFLLAPGLVASYGPVLRLARRVRRGASERGPLEVAAAACAWAAVVATIGLVLAPGPYFACCSGASLVVALFGLHRLSRLVRGEGDDTVTARAEARRIIVGGVKTGALWIAIVGTLLVPLRLYEQRLTRNPAVIAIHKSGKAGHCDVTPAGSEGEVSLWLIDCGSSKGPMIGWDEREKVLIQGERLLARVPGATTSVSTGMPSPPGFSTTLVPSTPPASPAPSPTH